MASVMKGCVSISLTEDLGEEPGLHSSSKQQLNMAAILILKGISFQKVQTYGNHEYKWKNELCIF